MFQPDALAQQFVFVTAGLKQDEKKFSEFLEGESCVLIGDCYGKEPGTRFKA